MPAPVPPASAVALVALGGALGAVARYGVGVVALRVFGPGLPVGTWAVNALGCVLVGLAVALVPTERVRLVVVVGGLGGFTTFSAYSAETVALFEQGAGGRAMLYVAASVTLSVLAVVAGAALGRLAHASR